MVSFRFSITTTAVLLSLIMTMSVTVISSVYAAAGVDIDGGGEEEVVVEDAAAATATAVVVEEHLLDFVVDDGADFDVDVDVVDESTMEEEEEDVMMSDGSALVVDEDTEHHHHDDSDNDNSQRRRLTYSYYYNNHKACRRYDGSNGIKNVHYKVYTIYNDWKKCEEKCNYYEPKCYAYEYSDYKRCEIWLEKPAKLSGYKKGFYCSIKKHYDDPNPPKPTPSPPKPNPKPTPYPTPYPTYKKPTGNPGKWAYYNGACRTKDGGAGYKDTHWYLYKNIYKDYDCQKKCYDYGNTCKAYEYSYGRCEIWHKDPGYYTYKDGYKCVLRKFN